MRPKLVNTRKSRMRIISESVSIFLCVMAGYASGSVKPPQSTLGNGWESFRLGQDGDLVLLPVQMAGNVYPFVLDTGSTDHSFDISLREHLGTPNGRARARGTGQATIQLETFKTPLLRVGSFDVPPSARGTSPVIDFARIRLLTEQDVRGVLGASFLKEKLVQFDFDQGILRIAPRSCEDNTIGKPLPLTFDKNGRPWVDNLQIGDKTESFMITTGANHGIEVHKWLFDALLADGKLTELPVISGETHAGPVRSRRGRLADFKWDVYSHHGIVVEEGVGNAIALRYLRRFVVTLDATGHRVYIRPGIYFNRTDYIDISGLDVRRRDRAIVAVAVGRDTPAERAGILVGDEVITINGVACRDMRQLEFTKRLAESTGTQLTLTLARQGKPVDVTLELVDLSMKRE